MKTIYSFILSWGIPCLLAMGLGISAVGCRQVPQAPEVVKIWEGAPHAAFPSLERYHGWWYCAFREGTRHVDPSGKTGGTLRVLRSRSGKEWESVASIAIEGFDVRDASLVVWPTGELAVYYGVSEYKDGVLLSFRSHYSVLRDGAFTEPKVVEVDWETHERWLWKVRRRGHTLYTVAYGGGQWRLLESTNGVRFTTVKPFDITPAPNEADMAFYGNNMYIVGRAQGSGEGLIGESRYPFQEWTWTPCGYQLGGPNICGGLVGWQERLLVGSREYLPSGPVTSIFTLKEDNTLAPLLTLPSGGDCSYPSMVRKGRHIYLAYYSSHEGNTSIYFTRL